MPESKKEVEVDFLDLPDDELPDYPPGDEPEANSETPEGTQTTNDDQEDVNDEHDETKSPEGSEGGEQSDDEAGDEEDDSEDGDGDTEEESEQGLEAPEGSSEEESDSEQVGDETSGSSEEGQQEKVAAKSKKGKGKKAGATELEVTATSSDAQLKQLFAPFRANGRDMQVNTVDDAVTLMKMGANYNKKMQGLKPNLRLLKMLDNNKLLDEEKLSYLIDLQNKNPQAIAKLLKESGVDPDELQEDNTDYTPGTYTVNEKEIDLDMVLDDIKDTPSFQKTIDAISTKWDAASRTTAQKDPNIIRVINGHMDSGLYDKIMDVVQNEKALGRLTELSDLQAYKHVGDTLQAQGALDPAPLANTQQPATKKAQQDPKLKNRKKAAGNPRSKPAQKQQAIDPLSLPDDEFEKMAATMKF